MAYTVMAHIVMATARRTRPKWITDCLHSYGLYSYGLYSYGLSALVPSGSPTANAVMAHVVTAPAGMAYVVMASMVMAYVVMACTGTRSSGSAIALTTARAGSSSRSPVEQLASKAAAKKKRSIKKRMRLTRRVHAAGLDNPRSSTSSHDACNVSLR